MKAIQLVTYGYPLEALKMVELPDPDPPNVREVLIGMEFSPINVSDLLLARGLFGRGIKLPSIIGGEGVGVALAVGSDVTTIKVGDRVLVPHGVFAWAEKVIAPADQVIAVRPGVDPQQASMLSINPPTAGLLLTEFVDLRAGDWIVQNSANSGVGRAVIAIAKSRGVKTINLVRRPELVDELRLLGADVVLVTNSAVVEEVKHAIGGAPVVLALDGVSGTATGILSEILSQGGKIVCYAAPTEEPISVSPFTLIAKHLSVQSLSMYYPEFLSKLPAWIERGAELVHSGTLHAPVAATYSPGSLPQALKHALGGGKVLLDFTKTA